MILDILFNDAPPIQYQHVRLVTMYNFPAHVDVQPELVIHFYTMRPQENIPLSRIRQVQYTND